MLQKISELQNNLLYLAYIYAIIGNTALVLMQIFMKIITHTLTPFFTLFIRGFMLLFINSFVLQHYKLRIDQPNVEVYQLLMKRSVFSALSLTCFMTTVAYIPIGIANSLFNTGPIIIHFLEAIYYKKPIMKIHLLLTTVCFLGVILIAKPAFLFGQAQSWPILLLMFPVIGAFFNSLSMLYLHELKSRVSNLIALQYFYYSQTFFSALLQNFQQFKIKQAVQLGLFAAIVGLVFFAYITQIFITRAIYLKKASFIMPVGYISIVVAFVSDIFIFGSSFDWFSILGMIMTSAGLLSKLLVAQN